MGGAIPSTPAVPSWRTERHLIFTFTNVGSEAAYLSLGVLVIDLNVQTIRSQRILFSRRFLTNHFVCQGMIASSRAPDGY